MLLCNQGFVLFVRIFNILFVSFIIMETTAQTELYRMEAKSIREFSSEFYKVVAGNVGGNIISSPLSVHVILSYLSSGAVGDTATEMIDGLSIKDIKRVHIGYKSLLATLKSTQAELYLSNAVYLHTNVQLIETFGTLGEEFYRFTIRNINFADGVESADTINDWVKDKTGNKIRDIIHPGDITDDTRAILVNAIYFKGQWRYPFDNQRTMDETFYLSEDIIKRVPTMKKKQRYSHGVLPELKAKFIEIPYTDENLSMVVIMPTDTYDLSYLEENFDWNAIVNASTSNHEIELHLPKFKIECTVDLEATLRKMGFQSMFEDSADFSKGFIDDSMKVNKIIQKAFIEVNEQGSEAAAATGKDAHFMHPEEFIVDRPFMIIIRHKPSDVSLFVGSVRDIDISVQKDEL